MARILKTGSNDTELSVIKRVCCISNDAGVFATDLDIDVSEPHSEENPHNVSTEALAQSPPSLNCKYNLIYMYILISACLSACLFAFSVRLIQGLLATWHVLCVMEFQLGEA